jgi:feruloyl esterase
MARRLLHAFVVPAGLSGGSAYAATDHAECTHLVMLKFPDVKVTEAVDVPAKSTGAITVAHCRVAGVIGTEIRFSLLLPDSWNHKFMPGARTMRQTWSAACGSRETM